LAVIPRSSWIQWIQKTLIFVLSAGVTFALFINFCATVFQCGCHSIWAGAAEMCNIHMEGVRHCPWCAHNSNYALAAMLIPQGLISFWFGAYSPWKRLAAALIAFPFFGGIAAVIYGLNSGYWKS
jgi:hypothetical protein